MIEPPSPSFEEPALRIRLPTSFVASRTWTLRELESVASDIPVTIFTSPDKAAFLLPISTEPLKDSPSDDAPLWKTMPPPSLSVELPACIWMFPPDSSPCEFPPENAIDPLCWLLGPIDKSMDPLSV